ncbi:FimV/HubP family polar landmark protein [Cellvibrio sp.]|uniref:FimV/HubP family polar landmark protein n=1 Tax=Cellvibrio sp. TaxID=1965322 RepID=UPI0039648301
MHLRKLVLACGFASFALSNYASALGLGEVKLKSTLNQPLSAEVQLLDTKGLSPEQIIVGLASSSEFERNGLDFVHFYTEFKFEVALDNPSGPIVRITSRNPVREPYLNFLVEAKWTSGRLLREYTLLMDLPTYDDAAPQAVQAARITSSTTTSAVTANKKSDPALEAEIKAHLDSGAAEEKPEIIAEQDQPAKKSKVSSGTYGPVGDKDTLWEIALAVRPDSSSSVHQTMLALQRLNPDAFIRGNINLLKKGQVLRVPDAAEISSVSQSEAVRQFNAQSASWSGNSAAPTDSAMGAQLDASRRTNTERVKSEAVAGRVRLEAPTSKQKSTDGQGSGANKGTGKALESELATTLEELERAKSEKTELSSRVHDLEEQVKTMQRLVDVSNEKLRALQLNSGKQSSGEKAPADTKLASDAKPAEATAKAQTSSVPAATTSSLAQSVSSAAAPAPAPKKQPAVKPAPAPAPEKTLVDQVFDNILWVGLGAAALLGAGGVALARRRKEQAEAEQRNSFNNDFPEDEPNFDAFNQAAEEQPDATDATDEMALFDEEDTTAVAETGDVVGEADIYIAYGKFDQAEEMLLNGLAKDPNNTDIRLKLLEVYSQTQNAPAFDKHYAVLLPLAGGLALSRAKELRANIPGIGEFDSTVAEAGEQLGGGGDFNLDDLDLDTESVQTERAVADQANQDDFAFDLDLDDLDAPQAEATPASQTNHLADMDDDFALDFDLDDAPEVQGEAEDLSDISLALDDMDNNALPEDVEVSKRSEEDFSFDFSDLDNEPSSLAQEANSIKSPEFNEGDVLADDFNLEMDVDKVDLAALDSEMASLDAELDMLDDEIPASAPSSQIVEEEFASVDEDEFKLDDIDSDLVDLDSSFEEPTSAPLDSALDDNDFSWEDDELELEEPEAKAPVVQEFAEDDLTVEDDDSFDLDGPVELADESSLSDLDLALSESEVDEESIEFDENSFAELDNELGEFDANPSNDFSAGNGFSEDSSVEEDFSLEDETPVAQENFAQLDNIDEEAIEEVVQANAVEDLSDDDVFEQALSDFSAESLAMDDASDMSDDDMDSELDFMADADEAATKLDLARAYMDMGDNEGARDILSEVAHEGNEQQRQEAVDLLSRIDA